MSRNLALFGHSTVFDHVFLLLFQKSSGFVSNLGSFSRTDSLLYCHKSVNVYNLLLFGRDVVKYTVECTYLGDAPETFSHH